MLEQFNFIIYCSSFYADILLIYNIVTAGTSFFDPVLSADINKRQTVTRPSIDRYSIVVMAGIAAEALNFDKAEGGGGDEMALAAFLSNINPNQGSSSPWTLDRIRNQARWGACQSILLLREYKACYEALVDALERGGKLGECVYAIEKAARDNNLEPLTKPIGFIRDYEPNGYWEVLKNGDPLPPSISSTETETVTPIVNTTTATKQSVLTSTSIDIEESDAVIEKLQQSREKMMQRLKEIENELSEME